MIRISLGIVAAACTFGLAACSVIDVQPTQGSTQDAQATPSLAPTQVATPSAAETPSVPTANAGENDGSPDITPAPLTGDAAKTETAARANLLAWARGIELREFDQAWNLMGDAAKAQTSKAQFKALFHPLHNITVAAPAGDAEGAAGSIFYTVPTTVTGTRADGTKATLKGEVVLRRVNDVDGATPAQLKWHIEQVNLKPA